MSRPIKRPTHARPRPLHAQPRRRAEPDGSGLPGSQPAAVSPPAPARPAISRGGAPDNPARGADPEGRHSLQPSTGPAPDTTGGDWDTRRPLPVDDPADWEADAVELTRLAADMRAAGESREPVNTAWRRLKADAPDEAAHLGELLPALRDKFGPVGLWVPRETTQPQGKGDHHE